MAIQIDIAAEVSAEIQKNLGDQQAAEIQAEAANQRQVGFQSSMAVAASFEPTKFAQALQVERASGIPAKVAYDNWDQVEKVKQQDKLSGLFNLAPRTADALSTPNNAIVAKGDEDNLMRMEQAIQKADFYEQGFFERQIAGPLRKWWDQDTIADTPGRLVQLDQISQDFERVEAGDDFSSPWANEYRNADEAGRKVMRDNANLERNLALDKARVAQFDLNKLPVDPGDVAFEQAEGVSGVLEVLADDPMWLGRVAAQSTPDMAQSLLAGLINPLLGGVSEGVTSANHKFIEVLREKGVDPSDPVQLLQALRNDELLSEANERSARYGAGIGAVSMASFGLLGRVMAPTTVGGKAVSAGTREWINAGVQVPVQGGLEALGELSGQFAERGRVSDIDAKEVALEGLVGALMAGPEAGAFATKRFTSHMIQSRRAERAAGLQGDMVARSLESSTRKNDPASFEAIVSQQLAGQPNEFIEIPAAKLQELNQSGMVNIPELLENVGIDPNHYTAQVELGGTIRMKNSSYLAYLSEHDDLLASSVRVTSNDYSLDEVQELDRQMVADMERIAGQFGQTDQVAAAYSDVMGQLLASGYERGAADTTARQYAAVMTRLAQQTGQTVEEVMAANPLNIGREVPEQVRRIKGDDLSLLLGRLRADDIPKPADMFGKTLTEYLTAAGGLADDGGELAAFDADVGKVGRNRLARADGQSPDDAAMAAWERGYFPGVAREDVTPNLLIDALREEAAGKPRYSVEQENATLRDQAAALEDLQAYLDEQGVDLETATDEEVLALLRGQGEQGEGQTLNQEGMPRMSAVHNLTEENLAFADRMGGIAVPSIGVVTEEAGAVEGFGDITMIASRDMVDPKKTPVFSADAYTVRFPRPEYPKVKGAAADRVVASINDVANEFDDPGVASRTFESMANRPDPQEVIFNWENSAAIQALYLREQGETVQPVMTEAVPSTTLGYTDAVQALNGQDWAFEVLAQEPAPEVLEQAAQALQVAIDQHVAARAQALGVEPDSKQAEAVRGRMQRIYLPNGKVDPEQWAKLINAAYGSDQKPATVDRVKTRDAVREQLAGREAEFKEWIDAQVLPHFGEPFLQVGKSKKPYTMENIVKLMTSAAGRGKEQTMSYGPGQVRAASSEQFKGLERMREVAATSIADPAEYNKIKEQTERQLAEWRQAAAPFFTFKDYRGQIDTWEAMDASMRALAKYSTSRTRNTATLERELKAEGFDVERMRGGEQDGNAKAIELIKGDIDKWAARLNKLEPGDSRIPEVERRLAAARADLEAEQTKAGESGDVIAEGMAAADALMLAPVPYFEAKPQRAVGLGEFAGAVIPSTASKRTREILTSNGIPFTEYDKTQEGARQQAMQSFRADLSGQGNDVLFQGGEDDTARGSITFGPRQDGVRQFAIRLDKKSDLSTVLHEMGHYYLEVIGDLVQDGKANEALVGDYAVIRDWLGAEAGKPITVDQHEQFARGFEKYLAEGKAPSIDLASSFARFKRWLTGIYKDLRRLNVELSPEVRGVFDRLLASEDAITEAEEALSLSAQFESSITALMTEAELANYTRASQQARDEATTEIEQEILRAEQRKEQAWYREQRKAVEREVRDELENSQPYQARKYLFGNQPHPQLGRLLRLDTAAVTELFGTKSKEARFLGRARAKENGIHPDIAASILGYINPVEMLNDMRSVPGLAEAIKAEVERVMVQRFPDPRVDGSLAEKAMAAVGEREAEVQAIQLRTLAREAGRKASQHRIIKEAARLHIAKLKLRDVIPYTFQRASTKAAKAVETALLDGNMPKAYEEKEKQLMNLHLYREAVKAQELAQQKRDQAKAYMKPGAKRKRLQSASVENYELAYPDGRLEYTATKTAANQAEAEGATVTPLFNFLEQVDQLLTKYEFGTPRGIIREQRQALASFLAWAADQHIVVNPPEWLLLDRAARTNWKDLTVGELADVVDMIRQIDQMAKNKLSVLKGDKWAEFEPLRDAIVATVEQNASKARNSQFNKSFADELRRWGREWLGQLPADQIARELDGQDDLGPVQENITTPVQVAGRNVVIREKAEHQGLADLIKQFYSDDQVRGMNDPSKLVAINEIGDSMTRMQMVMLMANLGNEGNRQALLSEQRKTWTAETIQAVMSRLNSNDADFVEALWLWIDKFWPEVAENEAKRTGVAPAKVHGDPYPVKLADGSIRVLRGGYFPLKYDGDLSIKTSQDDVADAFKNMTAGRTAKAYTPAGHKIERVGSGGRPVKLDFAVVTSHLSDVVRDIIMTDPVNQAWRFLHDKEVQGSFERSNLKELFTALEIWLQDVAEGEKVDSGYMTASARWLRTGFTANVMLFNLGNSMLNLAGTHPLVVLGKRWAMKGYQEAFRSASWEQMYELSSFMREARVDSYNKDLALVQDQMRGKGGWRMAMTAAGFWLHNKTQMFVDAVTWMGAYQKGMSMDLVGQELVTYADQRVVEASGSGVFADRAAMERGTLSRQTRQNELVRGVTMLAGYMIRKIAIARRRTAETSFTDIGQAVNWAVDMALLFTIEGLMFAAVKGNIPDEDDEPEEWVKTAAWETFAAVGAGLPPFGRPLVAGVQGFGGGSSSIDIFAEQFGNAVAQAKQGDADVTALKSVVSLAGTVTKTPGIATNRVIDWLDRAGDGDTPPWWELFTGNRDK